MDNFITYIESYNTVSIILRLVLAALFGGIVGIERENRHRSAGFRTFTLVCMASALATVVNLHLYLTYGAGDIGRIPAAVLSGIGFLGIGTIVITHKNKVVGLTTAACLWSVACLGIALGAGMIVIGTLSFVLIFVTVSILQKISGHFAEHSKFISLYVEVTKEDDIDMLINYLRDNGCKVLTFEKRKDKVTKKHVSVKFEISLDKRQSHSEFLEEISKLDEVVYVEEA